MFKILLMLIFIRPFIPSVREFSFPNYVYSFLLLIILLAWIFIKKLPLKKVKQVKYPLILFIAAVSISFLFSHDKISSLNELYKYVTGWLLLLVAASSSSEEKSMLIKDILLAAIFVSILGIYQYFFGFRHLSEYIARNNITDQFILDYVSRKRVFSPFVTPNVLAGFLAMVIPLALIDKKKFLLIIPLSFVLLLTQSIGAILSLLLGLIIYLCLQKNPGKAVFIFLSGLVAIIVLVLAARFATQKEHMHPVFSSLMRLNYWLDTLQVIKSSPLAGVGLGNFNISHSRYAHNSYLQLWAEMGILGIISFFWLIVTVFKSAYMNVRKNYHNNQTALLVFASTVFLAHNFIDFTFFLPEVAIIWWVISGLIITKDSDEFSSHNTNL